MTQQLSVLPALEIAPSKGSSEKDFDYFHGKWKVHNRKLRSRLTGCDEWSEYESEFECRPILRGFGNVGTFRAELESGPLEAFTLRLFNPETRLWTLCWAYSNAPVLDVPQVGSFDGDIGTFLARNFWEETPVIVKFNWDKSDVDGPVWSQAFSADEGKTWNGIGICTFRGNKETIVATASRAVNVAADYVHFDKFIEPDENLELTAARLKWHNLAREDEPVSDDIRNLARAFLEQESAAGKLDQLGDLGFVILHRCGRDFYFLLVGSWRNENELWETVYAKDGDKQPDFAEWPMTVPHHPTFCVWELAVVWHEKQAWTRYLLSARDEHAANAYLEDHYRGMA